MKVTQGKTILNLTKTEVKAIADFVQTVISYRPFSDLDVDDIYDIMTFIASMPISKKGGAEWTSTRTDDEVIINIEED